MRTKPQAVKDVLLKHYDDVDLPSLGIFIRTASVLVDKVAVADTASLLDSEALELLETWLAAHAYAHGDPMYSSKSMGGASGSFLGQTGMVFESTYYGQMALALDATGYLAELQQQALNGKRKAGGKWLGTVYRDDYSTRAEDQ